LEDRIASASWSISDFGTSARAFEQSASLATHPSARALYLARASFSHLWNHDYERCDTTAREAKELAAEHAADAATAFAMMAADECELVQGRALVGEEHISQLLELAEGSGEMSVLIHCLAHMGQRAEWRGDYRRAIEITEQAVAIATREHTPGDALFGGWFLGISLVSVGEYARGLTVLDDGLKVCDRIGNRAVKARLLNTLGWAHAEFGCHHRARDYNRMATDLAREMVELGLVPGAPELHANAAVNLAGNLIALGDVDAADGQLAPIQIDLRQSDDPWMRWRYSLHVLDAEARIDLARGEPERALSIAVREVEGARAMVARKIEARGLELQGRALVVLDRRDEADEALRAAIEVSQTIEYPPVVWRALAMRGELARRRGDNSDAQTAFDRARALVADKSQSLGDPVLQREFRAMGERLAGDPIETFR
jgi:tetratricopeptide (TPR) repeat protein